MNDKRNYLLDIFKILLIFPIICLHLTMSNETHVYFRITVPFFFLVSGYFLYNDNDEKVNEIAIKRIKSAIKYLLLGILIYVIYDLTKITLKGNVSGYMESLFQKDFIYEFVFQNKVVTSGYHMWFLVALLISYLIHFVCIKLDVAKLYSYFFLMFLVGYFFQAMLYNINGQVVSYYFTRSAFFEGFPLMCLGFILHKLNDKYITKLTEKYNVYLISGIFLSLGIIFFFLQKVEYNVLNHNAECYVSSVLSCAFFLVGFVNIKIKGAKTYYKIIGKNTSFYMFILHLMIGYDLVRFKDYVWDYKLCIVTFVISFICSVLIHNVIYWTGKLYKYTRTKCTN